MTYEEMIDYLTSKEVIAAHDKVREVMKNFLHCSNCKTASNLPSQYYLEQLSKNELKNKYETIKMIVETKLD